MPIETLIQHILFWLMTSIQEEPPPFPPPPDAPPVVGSPFAYYVVGIALVAWMLAQSGLRLRT
ncbi:MAG: hypothetical protein QXJ02_06250, partial [Candidatus Bathyarchaeia archaeon]